MGVERTAARGVRRLQLILSLTWGVAWTIGIAYFALSSIHLHRRLAGQQLEQQLAVNSMALYGLSWFDEHGAFHDDLLAMETELLEQPVEMWVLEPGPPTVMHLEPVAAQFEPAELLEIARRAMDTEADVVLETLSVLGEPCRVHASPMFRQDLDTPAHAAAVSVAGLTAQVLDNDGFVAQTIGSALLLGALGLGLGLLLARWSLRPLVDGLRSRERFLAGAAHELRNPAAALGAVCESGLAGDEPVEQALQRAHVQAQRLSQVVDDLLLMARLDSQEQPPHREPVRLDLLVEQLLETGDDLQLDLQPVVLEADPNLLGVALRNLVANAQRHGAAPIVVRVDPSGLSVSDAGPGFPATVLAQSRGAFSTLPSQRGSGFGLALVRLIAEAHDGRLELDNAPSGGARVRLRLNARSAS